MDELLHNLIRLLKPFMDIAIDSHSIKAHSLGHGFYDVEKSFCCPVENT
jgi:hypothetical protein